MQAKSLFPKTLLMALALLLLTGPRLCVHQARVGGDVIHTKADIKVREVKIWDDEIYQDLKEPDRTGYDIWDPVTQMWYDAQAVKNDQGQVTGFEMTPEGKRSWEFNVSRMRGGGGGNGY